MSGSVRDYLDSLPPEKIAEYNQRNAWLDDDCDEDCKECEK